MQATARKQQEEGGRAVPCVALAPNPFEPTVVRTAHRHGNERQAGRYDGAHAKKETGTRRGGAGERKATAERTPFKSTNPPPHHRHLLPAPPPPPPPSPPAYSCSSSSYKYLLHHHHSDAPPPRPVVPIEATTPAPTSALRRSTGGRRTRARRAKPGNSPASSLAPLFAPAVVSCS